FRITLKSDDERLVAVCEGLNKRFDISRNIIAECFPLRLTPFLLSVTDKMGCQLNTLARRDHVKRPMLLEQHKPAHGAGLLLYSSHISGQGIDNRARRSCCFAGAACEFHD